MCVSSTHTTALRAFPLSQQKPEEEKCDGEAEEEEEEEEERDGS